VRAAAGPLAIALALSASVPVAAVAMENGVRHGGGTVNGHALRLSDRLVAPRAAEELALLEVIEEVRRRRLDSALIQVEELVRRSPDFRLAQLVYADLLLAKSRPIHDLGDAGAGAPTRLDGLREEARLRLRHHLAPPDPQAVPEFVLQMSDSQSRLVLVDVAASRLYVIDNEAGVPRVSADYYVSTGKNGPRKLQEGDQRTPLGVYFVTTRIDAEELPDLYGSGAFPVNYPNEWDRRLGRTGYGIWIHGVPSDTYSRAPRASDGCLALPNPDLEEIWNRLEVGATPVIIADGVRWAEPGQVGARREEFRAALERWRRDWESLDFERYARHYAPGFHSASHDRRSWLARKRRVNAGKGYIRVRLGDVSAYAYPHEPGLVVATFEQDYRSDTFRNTIRKRQYWRRGESGDWRIVYEGVARFRPEDFRGIPYSARTRTAGIAPDREGVSLSSACCDGP